MPARTVKDYENIIARLRAPARLRRSDDRMMREQLAAGLAQPAIVVDLTLDQVAAQSRPPAARVAAARGVSPLPVPRSRSHDRSGCARRLAPRTTSSSCRAGSGSRRSCATPTGKQARPQTALSSLPNGAAAYAALIHAYTTTRMTAEQIHQLGLQEVARIEKEMEQLARADGFTGAVTEFEKQLGQRPGMRFASAGGDDCSTRETCWRVVQPALPRLFMRGAEDGGGRPADSRRSRGVDGVELHRRAPPTARGRRGST